MQKLFLTFFGLGLLKPAPGTWGSVGGVLAGSLIALSFGLQTLFFASILLCAASVQVINAYEAKVGQHDSSEIVIDEVAGVWLAQSLGCFALVQNADGSFSQYAVAFSTEFVVLSVAALVLFRFFDITKPSLIGRIDRNVKGGLGVMGDDMLAGAVAGLLTGVGFRLVSLIN